MVEASGVTEETGMLGTASGRNEYLKAGHCVNGDHELVMEKARAPSNGRGGETGEDGKISSIYQGRNQSFMGCTGQKGRIDRGGHDAGERRASPWQRLTCRTGCSVSAACRQEGAGPDGGRQRMPWKADTAFTAECGL